MADDDAGGTVLGFPRLTVPGVVSEDQPPDGTPVLTPLDTDLAPPASLSVPNNPELSQESESAEFAGPSAEGGGSSTGVATMSVVMMAGITVAALRGAAHFVGYLKARAEHRKAVEKQQKSSAAHGSPQAVDFRAAGHGAGGRGRVQSGPEFGRSTRHPAPPQPRSGPQVPATFRQSPTTPPGRHDGKTPEKRRDSHSDARSGGGGALGPERMREARRRALEASGAVGKSERLVGGGRSRSRGGGESADGVRGRGTGRTPRQPAAPDTIRGAARCRMAERIANGRRDSSPKPERSPSGPDTVRGAARRRVADRITTGSWRPSGGNKGPGGGATPATIRGALRARAVERIRNGRKPKPGTAPDETAQQQKTQEASTSGADLAVPVDAAKPGPAPSADGGKTRKARRRRKPRRVVTPGGATGARPWRSRPGRGRASRERKRRRPWWDRTEGARDRRRRPRTAPGAGGARTGTHGSTGGPADSGFGPPPGWAWSQGETHTVHRADRPGPHTAGAIGRGQAALPRAPYLSGHARPGTTAPPTPSPAGGAPVTIPAPRTVRGTQYADSDLTIYDVIEADADMGEEIAQGAEEAKQTAEGCDLLIGRLEALRAKVVELKVPGTLEDKVTGLIEKTGRVKARAEAIAETIPAAAEAITTAGDNAADRHKGLADAVRDAGHTAPAERDYHNE